MLPKATDINIHHFPFTLGHSRSYFLHSQKVKMCDIAIREQMNGIERDRTGGEMRLSGRDWF
jgi:hypothetical protein